MKRIIALLLALTMLAGLTACRAKQEAATAAASEPAPAAEPKPAADNAPNDEEDPPFSADIVGSWILVDSNDTELTEEIFPGVKEKGGAMQIDADGLLSWTVGSTSGTGRILTAYGDDVTAELSRGANGEMVPVAGLLERSTEALALYLNFGGVDLIWVHVPPNTQQ